MKLGDWRSACVLLLIIYLIPGCSQKPSIDQEQILKQIGETRVNHVEIIGHGETLPKTVYFAQLKDFAKFYDFVETNAEGNKELVTYTVEGTVKAMFHGPQLVKYMGQIFDNKVWEDKDESLMISIPKDKELKLKVSVLYRYVSKKWIMGSAGISAIIE